MNKTHLLWTLVAADVLLSFGTIGAEMFFGWTFPPPLAEFVRHRFAQLPGPGNAFQLVLLAACVVCAFGAWIGLVNYWRPARRLYLVSWAIWLLLILISGPSVMNSVAAMFRVMNAAVGGVIIGLVYFSELSHRFERVPVETAAPSGMSLDTHRA
jgi:hypothetical protein